MLSPQPSRPCPWWLPWLISIVTHAVILLAFSLVPAPGNVANPPIDTRLSAPVPDCEIQLFLLNEPARRQPASLRQASQIAAPTPVVPTVSPPEHDDFAAARCPRHAARGAGPASGPQPSSGPVAAGGATTVFFQTPARGRAIVYVVDRSISMGLNDALRLVKRELLASIARLPSDTRFQVIFFNRAAETIAGRPGLLDASAASLQQLTGQLDILRAEGGTDHVPALQKALALEPDVLYFLTDGNELRPEQVRSVTRLNHGRAVIHTIDFGVDFGASAHGPMQTLAHDNRGTWRNVRP